MKTITQSILFAVVLTVASSGASYAGKNAKINHGYLKTSDKLTDAKSFEVSIKRVVFNKKLNTWMKTDDQSDAKPFEVSLRNKVYNRKLGVYI